MRDLRDPRLVRRAAPERDRRRGCGAAVRRNGTGLRCSDGRETVLQYVEGVPLLTTLFEPVLAVRSSALPPS
eukprot:1178566-Prorocentrum_minimum.AAC.6